MAANKHTPHGAQAPGTQAVGRALKIIARIPPAGDTITNKSVRKSLSFGEKMGGATGEGPHGEAEGAQCHQLDRLKKSEQCPSQLHLPVPAVLGTPGSR